MSSDFDSSNRTIALQMLIHRGLLTILREIFDRQLDLDFSSTKNPIRSLLFQTSVRSILAFDDRGKNSASQRDKAQVASAEYLK